MCGIAGGMNLSSQDLETLKSSLEKRGPDKQSSITINNLSLVHTRLAIQDVENGTQPMKIENYIIIFNGEIYNHLELREKYKLKCDTNSDTETLLILYIKYGREIFNELDGMFAFTIYDKLENKLLLVRDRAGEKPLYYFKDKSNFIFASELNAIKKIRSLEIDEDKIYQYLRFGFYYRDNTPYVDCFELPAGHLIEYDLDTKNLIVKNWWDISEYYLKTTPDSFTEAKQKIDKYLTESIKRRLDSSDLEVGTFLSGGIDSGLVTAIASKHKNNLKTFTVSFEDSYDEAPLAELVAKKYNTDHKEIKISFKNLKNDIKMIINNYGEPFFDSSAIPSYYVSKVAKENLTVILNGDGADELFAGYRRYVPFSKYNFFKSNKAIKVFAKIILKLMPISNEKKSNYNYIFRLLALSSKKNSDCYLSTTSDIFEDIYDYAFIKRSNPSLNDFNYDFNNILNLSLTGLKTLMLVDFKTLLAGDLLVKMDIATMSNSLEGRSPFLSKELLEYAPTIKDKFKISGKTTKYILREIAKDYLPNELINQPKRGFEIPLKKWVNEDLKELIHEYLSSENAFSLKFVKKEFINNLLKNDLRISSEKRAKILWTLFVLEVWYENEKK